MRLPFGARSAQVLGLGRFESEVPNRACDTEARVPEISAAETKNHVRIDRVLSLMTKLVS